MTLDEFAAAEGLTMRVFRLLIIPQDQLDGSEAGRKWAEAATWFEATITGHGYEVTVQHGRGPANDDQPELAEILCSLADTARDIENADRFEDWAQEAGRNPDSRKAEADYEYLKRQAGQLRDVCGSQAAYEELLWQVPVWEG